MSLKNKLKNFFSLDDEEYEYEYIETDREEIPEEHESKDRTAYQSKAAGKQNVVSLQSVQKSSKVVLSEPRVYAEAQEIADHMKNRRAVVVNLQRIQHDQAKRIVDFLSGTVYASAAIFSGSERTSFYARLRTSMYPARFPSS
jgi:cell division inhibitor SepF